MTRLSVVDEMFLRTHRGLGVPIALQGLWLTEDTFDVDGLERLSAGLARGPLGRRVITPRVPGARRRWVRTGGAPPVIVEPAVEPDDVVSWGDRIARVDLDPECGPAWRLVTAPVTDGRSVLALVCSHAVADARLLIRATDAAITGVPAPAAVADVSDIADAMHQLSLVSARTARALGGLAISRERRSSLTAYFDSTKARDSRGPGAADGAWTPPSVVATFDAREWDRTAEAGGATPNTLFAALAAGVGRCLTRSPRVTVGVPVSVRAPGTDAANALAMSEIRVGEADSLGEIRAATKVAYRSRIGSPAGFPDELLAVIPDRLAARLTPNPGQRDVLCSNIGHIPNSAMLGTRRTKLTARAVHPGLTADAARSMRSTVSAYLSSFGRSYTLCLTGTSPDRTPNTAALHHALDAACARWGLEHTTW